MTTEYAWSIHMWCNENTHVEEVCDSNVARKVFRHTDDVLREINRVIDKEHRAWREICDDPRNDTSLDERHFETRSITREDLEAPQFCNCWFMQQREVGTMWFNVIFWVERAVLC
jgi:hypothetical protein